MKWNVADSGRGSNAKIIPVHLYPDEGDDALYMLTARQCAALLKISTYLEWRNRYEVLPTDLMDADAFQAWNDDVKKRLMSPMEICAEIINCIENDDDVKNALLQFLGDNGVNTGYPQGKPLPTEETTRNLAEGTNPSCDTDILWAQAYELMDWSIRRVTDTLQLIEVQTNAVETAQSVAGATVIGDIAVDDLISFINNLQEFVAENFLADITDEYLWGVSCDVFCACQLDCEITIDTVFNVLYNRVKDHYAEEGIFQFLHDLFDYVAGFDVEGGFVADVALFMLWGAIKLGNWIWGGLTNQPDQGTKLMQLVLNISVNNANNDWVFLCDCSGYDWFYEFDFRDGIGTWVAGDDFFHGGSNPSQDVTQGHWVMGEGIVSNPGTPPAENVTENASVRLTLSASYTGSYVCKLEYYNGAIITSSNIGFSTNGLLSTVPNNMFNGSATGEFTKSDVEHTVSAATHFYINLNGDDTAETENHIIRKVYVAGTGVNPFE